MSCEIKCPNAYDALYSTVRVLYTWGGETEHDRYYGISITQSRFESYAKNERRSYELPGTLHLTKTAEGVPCQEVVVDDGRRWNSRGLAQNRHSWSCFCSEICG